MSKVEAWLGQGGALAKALPRYEFRPQQLAMAKAVEDAFAERAYLLAEAGTGTGKTLAYLVPAVLSGRKVVISTATKTLQEQIFFKDVPLLRQHAKLDFSAAYLKGRSNYLCVHRFASFDAAPLFSTREEESLYPSVKDWTQKTQSGDRAELNLPENYQAWRELSATHDTCLGRTCPQYDSCFVTRARQEAERADLVVVNHHLFFADLSVRERGAEGILPDYDAVIFDEAHAIEDVATEYFGHQVSSFRFEDLAGDAARALEDKDERRGMLQAMGLKIRGSAEGFFRQTVLKLGLDRTDNVRLTQGWSAPLTTQVEDLLQSLLALSAFCAQGEEAALTTLARRSAELARELDFIRQADDLGHVYWAERRGRGTFLKEAPIEVGPKLRGALYPRVDTAIFTSATLSTQGNFAYLRGRLGLTAAPTQDGASFAWDRARTVTVESPFDFPRQAALYAPSHLPEPNAPGFIEQVSEELLALCEITQGRAFALFTSLRNMERAHQLLRNRLPYQVLLQGELPKRALLEAFQKEPSVLFASHSFWEGVDVPGEALSLVVMDKLPFASPGDPLVASRIAQLKEQGEDAFGSYQLPQALLSLRQGFGRLIRTRDDRGIVAVLDVRLHQKRYGQQFLRALPKAKRFTEKDPLRVWFQG